jgi:hydroxyacylglutathione hydrolase
MKTWETKSGCKITQILAGRSNVFLVANGDKNILIDTGPGNRWKKLDRRLRKMHVDRLEALVLTHAHYDHAGNAARLKEKYKARVIVNRHEALFLAKGDGIISRGTNMYSRFLVNHLTKKLSLLSNYEPCRPDVQVDVIFDLNDFGFPHVYVMPTPGHTAGSQSVIVDDEVAIVGDAMFGVCPGSVFPPFAEDIAQTIASWGKLLVTNCRIFLPAHGRADSRALLQKDFARRNKTEK